MDITTKTNNHIRLISVKSIKASYNMNTIRNSLKSYYSQIPNELIIDTTISPGALRVLLYLFTKPDNWNVYNKDICNQLNINEKTLTKYWKELLNSKWLRRERKQNKDGKFIGGNYFYRIGIFTVSDKMSDYDKSGGHSKNNSSKKQVTYIYDEFKQKFSFIEEESFNKLVSHLKTKYKDLTKTRITNNIKKLKDNQDLFSLAVDKMIELDYNGLFIPSRKETKTPLDTYEEIKEF